MVQGSVFNRSGGLAQPSNNRMPSYIPMASVHANNPYGRLHDPIGYIAPERAQAVAAMPAMPVPVGVFMNMTHAPPRFHHGGHQSGMPQQGGLYGKPSNNMRGSNRGPGGGQPPRSGKGNKGGSSLFTQSTSQNTQDMSSQSFSQSGMPLTQGMSQVNLAVFFFFLELDNITLFILSYLSGNVANSCWIWRSFTARPIAIGSFSGCLPDRGISIANGWVAVPRFDLPRRSFWISAQRFPIHTSMFLNSLFESIEFLLKIIFSFIAVLKAATKPQLKEN